MSGFWLRTANEADLTSVATLMVENLNRREGMEEDQRKDALSAILESVEGMKARLEQPQAEFLVMDDGKEIGAMAFGAVDDGKTISIYRLAVGHAHDPEQEDFGKTLLDELSSCFPGAGTMRVEVEEGDEPGIELYRRNGFETIERLVTARSDGPPSPALIMERKI